MFPFELAFSLSRIKKGAALATVGFLAFHAAACDAFLLLAQVFGVFIMVVSPGPRSASVRWLMYCGFFLLLYYCCYSSGF